MLLECSHCGAPLDVREGSSITKCRYCGAANQVRAMRTVAEQTPPAWRPPPTWTPPPHVPADSNVTLPYRTGNVVALILAIPVALTIVGGLTAVLATKGARGGAIGANGVAVADNAKSAGDFATLTMRESMADLEARFGVKGDGTSLRVPLNGSTFTTVTFEWDAKQPAHVARFYLNGPDPSPDGAAIRARLEADLPKRWRENSWQWNGAVVSVSNGFLGISVTIPSENEPSRPWREQVEGLWMVFRHAALGLDVKVDKDVVRDFLGGGISLVDLAKFDYEVDVDHATDDVKRVAPGVTQSRAGSLELKLALDHPVFSEAELQWTNAKGGKLALVYLRPVGTTNKLADQDALAKCVESGLGVKPRVNEGDYLAKQHDQDFTLPAGGEVRVYDHLVTITTRDSPFSAPMKKATWEKVLSVLDGCGRVK
jgi:hypothetical protein